MSSSTDDLERLKNEASSSDGTGDGNENSALSSPNSSRSPEESVFSIDDILEAILEKCDRQTLLNSRLVSRRWAIYGSKELQKTVSIIFHTLPFAPGKPRITRFVTNKKRSLKHLITLMNNSTEFPCTSFDFRGEIQCQSKRKSSAQSFFDAHGAIIKKIKFQTVYIDDLKNFLLSQAPNLQQLYLKEMVSVEEEETSSTGRSTETDEQRSERERSQGSLFDEATSKPKPILKNLKKFRCRVSLEAPEILIRQILEYSPNLVDVALPAEHLRLLVRPTNRVHLVKKLMIDINSLSIESYELFANHVYDNTNFSVRELHYCTAQNDGDDDDEEFSSRVKNVIGKILRASSATCRKLVWGQEVANLQIPRMPRVKHLAIEYAMDGDETDEDEDEDTIERVNSLGDGVSLGDTFPNLKSLELRTRTDMGFQPIANIFNDVDPLPAANVKTVTMRLWHPRRKIVQSFNGMFPNATFRQKVRVDSDDDGDSDQGSGDDESDNDEEKDDQENYRENSDRAENSDEEYDEWALKPPRSLRMFFKMGKY